MFKKILEKWRRKRKEKNMKIFEVKSGLQKSQGFIYDRNGQVITDLVKEQQQKSIWKKLFSMMRVNVKISNVMIKGDGTVNIKF